MKLRSSIVVNAGDELVGGVYTRRGGECPKPELWVEAQKEKRLVGGEKKWAEDRSGAFAFCRCRCLFVFWKEASVTLSEVQSTKNVLGLACALVKLRRGESDEWIGWVLRYRLAPIT